MRSRRCRRAASRHAPRATAARDVGRRCLDLGVDRLDRGVEVGQQRVRLGRREAVDARRRRPRRLDRARRRRVRGDQLRSSCSRSRRPATAPPIACTRSISARAPATSSADLGGHDQRPLEEVGVLQEVGLVGQHLLDPQRPLLVPRPRQPERLVPRGQLDGAGAGVLGQRDRRASRARSAARCSPAGPRSGRGS